MNPRPVDINIYDEANNRRRTTIAYTSFNLPETLSEWSGSSGTTLERRAVTYYRWEDYYISRRIIGLVNARFVYNGTGGLESKVDYHYDWEEDYLVAQAPAVQHDAANYPATFVRGRGNLVAARRFNVTAAEDTGQAMWLQGLRYNMGGSVVLTEDGAGHQTSISYTDSFSDNVNRGTLAYPTSMTDAGGFTATRQYSFDHGGVTRVQTPQPNLTTYQAGPVQTLQYDAVGRVEQATNLANNSYVRYVYPAAGNYVQQFTRVDASQPEAYSWQVFDGAGRTIGEASDHPGSVGGYSGVDITYDGMGRMVEQSNPFEMTGSWTPAGDDSAGRRYTTQTYDWMGRPLVTTAPDGTTREASYGGCGCAGGAVVTLRGEELTINGTARRRQQVVTHDVLGRAFRMEEMNWDGTVYRTLRTSYNARDQVTQVTQTSAQTGATQTSTIEYDGHGRVWKQQRPEQTAQTVYLYNADDTVQQVTDARGATVNFSYNNRQLMTLVQYGTPNQTAIPDAPDVSYTYDAAGNRKTMTDGLGSVSYEYDQLSRLASETRQFTGIARSHALSYQYNLGNSLTSITDPDGAQVNYQHDRMGRVTGITGVGYRHTTYSGPYGQIAETREINQFASNIRYRAWGSIRGLTYGDNRTLSVNYNERLQPSRYEVSGVITKEYEYHADGRLRYSRDLIDNRLDRSYAYDHVGRLWQARSGAEARGEPATSNRPYNQEYLYDGWDNLTYRSSYHWSAYYDFSTSYTNNRHANWQYDAAGNVVHNGEQQFIYDAAGRRVSESGDMLFTYSYDGDSRLVKRNMYGTDYYDLRSSVLGGQALAELGHQGQKIRGFVYLGEARIVKAEYGSDGQGSVIWRHVDPSNASVREVYPDANRLPLEWDLDPAGAQVHPIIEYGGGSDPPPPREFGSPENLDMGCTLDGINIPCSWAMQKVNGGAAVFAPPETTRYNGSEFEFFRAFADGTTSWEPFSPYPSASDAIPFAVEVGSGPRTLGFRTLYAQQGRRRGRARGGVDRRRNQTPQTVYLIPMRTWTANGGDEYSIPVQSPNPECDRQLAEMFGGEGAVAAGSGYEPPDLPQPQGGPEFRPHVYRVLHLYNNSTGGKSEGRIGLYAPAGGGVPFNRNIYDSEGRDQASWGIFYAELGNVRNVTLVFSHLANFTNPGSITTRTLIGYIGGPGGVTMLPNGRLSNPPYIHSHLAILDSQGRNISFYDVICRRR